MKIKSEAGHHVSNRKLKISSKSFARSGYFADFPEIRVAGKWLEENGFAIGNSVTLYVECEKITIVADPVSPVPKQDELDDMETKRNRRKMQPLEKHFYFRQPPLPLIKDCNLSC